MFSFVLVAVRSGLGHDKLRRYWCVRIWMIGYLDWIVMPNLLTVLFSSLRERRWVLSYCLSRFRVDCFIRVSTSSTPTSQPEMSSWQIISWWVSFHRLVSLLHIAGVNLFGKQWMMTDHLCELMTITELNWWCLYRCGWWSSSLMFNSTSCK